MNSAGRKWIQTLPRRWTLGGFVVAVVVLLVTMAVDLTIPTTPMHYVEMVVRIVLPFAVFGLAWGWHERRAWRAAVVRESDGVQPRLLEYHLVQGGKGAIGGLVFGALFAAPDAVTRLDYDTTEAIAVVIAGTGVGAVIGLILGSVARANLRRRLRREPPADPGPAAS